MKSLHYVAFLVLVIGGLNWLLIGVVNFDLVMWLLGRFGEIAPKIVYVLVGLAAIYELLTHKKNCRDCSTTSVSTTAV